jgi:hypothetical protein
MQEKTPLLQWKGKEATYWALRRIRIDLWLGPMQSNKFEELKTTWLQHLGVL